MIAFLRGKIIERTPASIILDVNGVGYEVHISLHTYEIIEDMEEVSIRTYLHVREDRQMLYGFVSEHEKKLFLKLISVSGVGTSTARMVLSTLRVEEVVRAVRNQDAASFKRVKGVGAKTAQRILIDLKDKVDWAEEESEISKGEKNNTDVEEALSALVALGFKEKKARKALKNVRDQSDTSLPTELWVKKALQQLS